jgi:hypothetical protein
VLVSDRAVHTLSKNRSTGIERETNMSVLSEYSPEEQMLLMEGPRLGAIVVSAASLGRKAETASEGFATAKYVLESRGDYIGNALVSSIQYELEKRAHSDAKFADYVELASAPGAKEAALARLRLLADLLASKVDPDDAAGYKQWVVRSAVLASEAGQEGGGFLGRGAVQVNDAEREALAEVSAALGSTAEG